MPKLTCCAACGKFLFIWLFCPLSYIISVPILPFFTLISAILVARSQRRLISTPAKHRAKVVRIQKDVQRWDLAGRSTRMCTGKPIWTSFNVHAINKSHLTQIRVDDLNKIVELDEVNCVLTVEPGVMMGQLTAALIPRGWTIGEIPEFETLTVGGLICGTGVESSSCQYGFFSGVCTEYEVVTSEGTVLTCTKDQHSDLFYAIPWSHGTLGFLTAVKIPLIPAKPYVRLQYHRAESLSEAQRLLEATEHEFVEGLAYGRQKYVVMHGNMADKSTDGNVNHINRWYKTWFFRHAEEVVRDRTLNKPYVEYIPLQDYYHRHTRFFFWEGKYFMSWMDNGLWRFFFGWSLPANPRAARRIVSFVLGDRIAGRCIDFIFNNHMVEDFVLPIRHLARTIDFVHDTVEIYPLWLCPVRFFKSPGMTHSGLGEHDPESELYIDVGIYGDVKRPADYHVEHTTRKFEAFALAHGGVQFFYAYSFLTREEFCRMFDMELYNRVRANYGCEDAFPHVYDKISKQAREIDV